MTRNASIFTNIQKLKSVKVTFGDDGRGDIIGIGKIGKDPLKTIDTAYLVDGLKYNLLSISQLYHKGNYV